MARLIFSGKGLGAIRDYGDGLDTAESIPSFGAVASRQRAPDDPIGEGLFAFSVLNSIGSALTGYEWRLYVDDPTPGVLGTTELAGEESATTSSQAYPYDYYGDVTAILQIIKAGYEEHIEDVTLSDSTQNLKVRLREDENL